MEDVVKFPVDASKLDPATIIALILSLLTQFGPQILVIIQDIINAVQANPSATVEEVLSKLSNPASFSA